MFVFSDACPTDWLGTNDCWHTIANFTFESDPNTTPNIQNGTKDPEVLTLDQEYQFLLSEITKHLPNQKIKSWKSRGSYKQKFYRSLKSANLEGKLLISAVSFLESSLIASESALKNAYYVLAQGSDGRGLIFNEYTDAKGRVRLQQKFVSFDGTHDLDLPKSKVLVIYLMAFFFLSQHDFYQRSLTTATPESLKFTVVTDYLSGDDDNRKHAEMFLRTLLNPDGDSDVIEIAQSKRNAESTGDFLADNIAGMLNGALADPKGEMSKSVLELEQSQIFAGWHILLPSTEKLERESGVSVLKRLKSL